MEITHAACLFVPCPDCLQGARQILRPGDGQGVVSRARLNDPVDVAAMEIMPPYRAGGCALILMQAASEQSGASHFL